MFRNILLRSLSVYLTLEAFIKTAKVIKKITDETLPLNCLDSVPSTSRINCQIQKPLIPKRKAAGSESQFQVGAWLQALVLRPQVEPWATCSRHPHHCPVSGLRALLASPPTSSHHHLFCQRNLSLASFLGNQYHLGYLVKPLSEVLLSAEMEGVSRGETQTHSTRLNHTAYVLKCPK